MANADSNRKAIWWLGSALAVSLLVLAFLLGRESARLAPMVETPDDDASSETDPAAAQALQVEEEPDTDSPTVDDGATEEPVASIDQTTPRAAARLERRPDGKIVLSNTRSDEKRNERRAVKSRSPAGQELDQPKSVGEYLDRMDGIRSDEEAADPNAFAMALINAGVSGSTEGFDRLIADTESMEQEMKSITPPPSCEKYHQASLEALRHGRGILVELKAAISNRDVTKVAAVAQEAAALQVKTDELSRLETNLRAVRQRPRR